MFQFGSGTLWGYPVGGNLAANPTPIKFGTLQDVSLEISGSLKELHFATPRHWLVRPQWLALFQYSVPIDLG